MAETTIPYNNHKSSNQIYFIMILFVTTIGSPVVQWSSSNSPKGLVEALAIRSDTVVTDLLSALFKQTIYNRIENLLLDPGRKSTEKQKIIDSAVDNYHKQKMVLPTDYEEVPTTLADLTGKPLIISIRASLQIFCSLLWFCESL